MKLLDHVQSCYTAKLYYFHHNRNFRYRYFSKKSYLSVKVFVRILNGSEIIIADSKVKVVWLDRPWVVPCVYHSERLCKILILHYSQFFSHQVFDCFVPIYAHCASRNVKTTQKGQFRLRYRMISGIACEPVRKLRGVKRLQHCDIGI